MIMLSELNFELPLRNPVIIFSLVLFIILFAPILFNKIRVPPIIGLILAGVIIGPFGLNLLLRDSSIVLFGTVGLLYIMFTAGLEIDLEEFKKNRFKSLVFGLFTFLVPLIMGSVAVFFILNYDWPSSMLLASMFASHTLLAYPITSRYGINRIRSVTLTIGGTIITDILALLVLAAIVGMYKGDISSSFWIRLAVSSSIFAAIVMLLFPLIARWFFKKFDDNISQYIFVLAIVFLGSFLAEAAGLEAIIGAFLSGLALNRFIPHASPLMNRIEFVGNALFIPFFLIGVGMLVDFRVLFNGLGALQVAGTMIVLAVVSKFVAAWFTQKTFKLMPDERQIIFGLSNARVGATLAVVLVGYNVILGETPAGEPIRLLNEDVLNGTILMILVTCTISSFTVEKVSRRLALQQNAQNNPAEVEIKEKILISLAYPNMVNDLTDLALLMKPHKSKAPFYALHVRDEQDSAASSQAMGKHMMDNVIKHAAATDHTVIPINRFDLNICNGIIFTIKEYDITDLIMGMHKLHHGGDGFWGSVTEKIIERVPGTIFIYKPTQPINTLKRIIVTVPARAEYEQGFQHWVNCIYTLSRATSLPLYVYADDKTFRLMRQINDSAPSPVNINFEPFDDWSEFLIFSREVKPDDLFIIVTSRKGHLSYEPETEKLSHYLLEFFSQNSYIILYPEQLDGQTNPNLKWLDENTELLDKAGSYLKNIYHRG